MRMQVKKALVVALSMAVAASALAQDAAPPIPPAPMKPPAMGLFVYPGSGQDASKQS